MEHKKISNPLTMIGVFAGIAEIAGTVVLPFVVPELQKVFIWYVMGFPVFLVGLFFYTLIKHSISLYSPSDFRNEDNYVRLYHQLDKIKDTVESVDETTKSAINSSVETAKTYLDSIMHENINSISEPAILPLKFIYLLNENPDGLTSREISERLKITQATTHRMLKTLKMNDLIKETPVSITVNGTVRQVSKYLKM